MIKLAQIRQFVTLAEEGSFHHAASVLNMAQPPLSVGIRKLEEELGAPLFVRGPRGVKLTSAGELALVSARQTLLHVDEMRNAVRSALIGERGRLRVGFVVSATLELLPRLLIAYRARYPQIELKLEESRTADLLEDVGQGRIDLAIVRTPVMQRAGVMIEQLQSDTLCLAVPKGSKWSGRKRVDLGELRDEPFVVFSRERVPNMHAITMLMCQREGFVPIVAEEAGQLQTILCLVESGIGVALVPGVAARQAGGFELLSIGISPDDTAIGLSMVTRVGEISAATQNFRTIAREVCGSAS
jgi:DNA-binding transcriptional LysR family regulator